MLGENVNLVLNHPIGLALYRKKSERNSGPETYYLPLSAIQYEYCRNLLTRYSGTPCEKPDDSEVEIAVEGFNTKESLE